MGCAEVKNWPDTSKITDMVKTCTRYSRDLIGESELSIWVYDVKELLMTVAIC